ncbi:MAG: iron-containing alcohol dehydrogenase [Lachnospiraceae bacterium]
MGMQYMFHAPAVVTFAEGARFTIGDTLKKWGVNGNVLLVHGKNVKAAGLVDEMAAGIEGAGFKTVAFDKVLPDAPVEVIREGVAFAKENKVAAIVAIGGGSGMDIAKAIAVMMNNEGDILNYVGMDVVPNRRNTLFVAVPTTCGTGSEMTDGGVVYDAASAHKLPFWDVFAGPDIAILDPFMLQELPTHLIAQTALDAFAHSVEALTSVMANPISDAVALGAIEIIAKYTPIAYADKTNKEALEMLLTASTMAGMAFNRSSIHAGHVIAHAVGAIAHIHHGAACALAMPLVLQEQALAVPEKVRRIAAAMGMNLDEKLSAEEVGKQVAAYVKDFNASLNINSFGQYGIKEEQIEKILQYTGEDVMMQVASKPIAQEMIGEFIKSNI